MAVSDWRYGICPHCGYINFYVKPSKFPICKCCDYEDPIIITNDERHNLVVSIKASINEQKSNEELADIIDEALREKYVYDNEHFSKKAYNDMLEYTERKEKEAKAFFSSNSSDPHTPKCPTLWQYRPCAKCLWVQRLCPWACSVSLARKLKRLGIVTAVDMNGNAAQRGVEGESVCRIKNNIL